ncbi:hypothetical protein SNEBB_006213 [Seison nebaliae]|nr:hypothetical protein SNEBB_006213 [Seison nebaliae]
MLRYCTSYIFSYFTFFTIGYLGLHHVIFGEYLEAFYRLTTFNYFGIGFVYDLFTLNSYVRQKRLEYEESKNNEKDELLESPTTSPTPSLCEPSTLHEKENLLKKWKKNSYEKSSFGLYICFKQFFFGCWFGFNVFAGTYYLPYHISRFLTPVAVALGVWLTGHQNGAKKYYCNFFPVLTVASLLSSILAHDGNGIVLSIIAVIFVFQKFKSLLINPRDMVVETLMERKKQAGKNEKKSKKSETIAKEDECSDENCDVIDEQKLKRRNKSLFWNMSSKRSTIRFILFLMGTSIICSLLTYNILMNARVTLENGDEVLLMDAINQAFNSETWKLLKLSMRQVYNFWKANGYMGIWKEVKNFMGDGDNVNKAYETLSLRKTATQSDIDKECKRLSRKWHPDRFRVEDARKKAEEKFIEIQNACNLLSKLRRKKASTNSASL